MGGQFLQKAQGEFLPMILDGPIAAIDTASFEQFLAITPSKFGPAHAAVLELPQQDFARTKVSHPDIIKVAGQATAAKAARQDSQPVVTGIDGRENRFGP